VGARGALVKTGYGLGELTFNRATFPREPDLIAEHALEAVIGIVGLVKAERAASGG
jgi:hypothetical protein